MKIKTLIFVSISYAISYHKWCSTCLDLVAGVLCVFQAVREGSVEGASRRGLGVAVVVVLAVAGLLLVAVAGGTVRRRAGGQDTGATQEDETLTTGTKIRHIKLFHSRQYIKDMHFI
jgi:hypothetical protein